MAARGLTALLAIAATVAAGPVHPKRGTSSIWCGPVLGGRDFRSVEASWTIPNVSYPANADKHQQYFSSQWVGIDGTNGCKGLLQAGTSQGVSSFEFDIYYAVKLIPALSWMMTRFGIIHGSSFTLPKPATSIWIVSIRMRFSQMVTDILVNSQHR